MFRVSVAFYSDRLALLFSRLARRLTNNGFADDYLSMAIKLLEEEQTNDR